MRVVGPRGGREGGSASAEGGGREAGAEGGRARWSERTWWCDSLVCRADFFNKGAGAKFLEGRHGHQRQTKGNEEMLLDILTPKAVQRQGTVTT